MEKETQLEFPQERVTAFCQRHAIRKLALFGSAAREDLGPDSDIDVLVEFEPGHVPGFAFLPYKKSSQPSWVVRWICIPQTS